MKIILKHKGSYNQPEVIAFLKSHAKTAEKVMSKMAVTYKISTPCVMDRISRRFLAIALDNGQPHSRQQIVVNKD